MKHGRRRTFLVRLLCVAPLAALVVGGSALSADAATTRAGVSVGGSALDTIGDAVGAITVPHTGGSAGTAPSTGAGTGVGPGVGSGIGSGAGSGGDHSAIGIGVGAGVDSKPGPDADQPATDPGSTPSSPSSSSPSSSSSSSSSSTPSSSSGSSSDQDSGAASGDGKATGAKAGTRKAAGTKAKWVAGTVSEVGLTAGDSSDGDENRVSGGVQSGQISAQLMAAATSFGWTNLGILILITLLWGAWQVVKFRQRSARDRKAPNENASFLESLPEPEREPSFRELISS